MIERGNQPFKQALQNWMQVTGSENWSLGAYIVNAQLNRRPSASRGNMIPYKTYTGQKCTDHIEILVGNAAKDIKTEVGLQILENIMVHFKTNYPKVMLTDELLGYIIKKGDDLYNEESVLSAEEQEEFDIDLKIVNLENKIINWIVGEMNTDGQTLKNNILINDSLLENNNVNNESVLFTKDTVEDVANLFIDGMTVVDNLDKIIINNDVIRNGDDDEVNEKVTNYDNEKVVNADNDEDDEWDKERAYVENANADKDEDDE